ncbi:MAG: hypothetical protein ACI9XP_000999 [Lentimonas sp.]|jgi:hypothetical protein
MKKYIYLLGCLVITAMLTSSKTEYYPSAKNQAFGIGEKLRYRVSYGFVDAGEAILEVKSTSKKGNGRDLYRVTGSGRTLGAFNAFYKVEDKYESFIDKQGIFPWFFERRVNEGGYIINQDYTFKQHQYKVNNGVGKEYKTPMAIQDMISSFYYARTMDFSNLKQGDVFEFKCFMDDEIWSLKVKYVKDETISIRKGKFKCHKFVPVVQTGRYFESEEDVNFWITADKNRIPVLVKAKIPVGTIKMHLVEWENLKNPLSSKQ